jgi:hypothetical protein
VTKADPLTAHVAALERALHGPARARRSMITEVRDGLHDAEEAYRHAGLDPQRAAAQAVRDFGAVHDVAPSMQEELTARQARWAAALLAVVFPALLQAWDLLWVVTGDWQPPPAPPVVRTLAGAQDGVSWTIAAAAPLLLLATFRRTTSPRRITAAVGLIAALGTAACGGLTIAMGLVNVAGLGDLVARHPLGPAVIGVTIVLLAVVIRSAVRSLRLARCGERDDHSA